nr:hypothetical protein [Tanacetum cinerariifolium]
EILNICPKVLGKAFDEPPTEEEALTFIRELGHTREIKYITYVIVDHLHQSWRNFASIINKCVYGKEDLAYQSDKIDFKKQDKMIYPRFTKIITHHFLTKDKSISMMNKMFMHTARDDSVLGTMRFISRHADTQVYGAILSQAMTNQALLDYVAYKMYHVIASGAEPLMSKKNQKKSKSAISSVESLSKKKSAKAKKDAATKPKPTKKKEPVKANRGNGLNVLLEVAISKADQLKEATKQSKEDFYISHVSGSGDRTDLKSEVLDEQQRKTSSTDEGTGTILGVLDVPKCDSESDKESYGDSGEEDNDDEDDTDDGNNDDGNENNDNGDDDKDDDGDDNDDDSEDERTESDRDKIPNPNKSNEEHDEEEEEVDERVYTPPDYEVHDVEKIDDVEKMDEEEDDDVTKELYKEVNVNLGNKDADMTDADMTDADQGGADRQNASQQSGFEQEEEDAWYQIFRKRTKTGQN